MSFKEPISHGHAGELDKHFGKFIARFGGDAARVEQIAAALSRAVQMSHLCLDLKAPPPGEAAGGLPWPSFDECLEVLRASRAVEFLAEASADASDSPSPVETAKSSPRPLVVDRAGRLYLRRYFEYEQTLAAALRDRAEGEQAADNTAPGEPARAPQLAPLDDQEVAVETALRQRLTIISGGPGTGKTTTVVKVLRRLLEQERPAKVALGLVHDRSDVWSVPRVVVVPVAFPKLTGNAAEWRRAVRQWFSENLQGEIVTNRHTGLRVKFTAESKVEAPSKLRKEEAMRAIQSAESVVREALWINSVPPADGASRAFHYFLVPIELEGRIYSAWFNVREPLKKAEGADGVFYEFGVDIINEAFPHPKKDPRVDSENRASTEKPPVNTTAFLRLVKGGIARHIPAEPQAATFAVTKGAEDLLDSQPLRIALAAPTGKAAARLEQAVRAGIASDPTFPASISASIPPAVTLHRLLGARSDRAEVKHHAKNPLPVDVLVVDEASMIDLPLMAKLFEALPPHARIILLGDQDQLASVDPGNVLADIAAAASEAHSPLRHTLAILRMNYRFGNESGIYKLAGAVRNGQAVEAFGILQRAAVPDLHGAGTHEAGDLSSAPLPPAAQLPERLAKPICEGFGAYLREQDPVRALELLQNFRVLTAVRRGTYGVEALNQHIRTLLVQAGLMGSATLKGMPILVTVNDHALQLFNGDIGILLPDPAAPEGALWAWFPADNAHPAANGQKRVLRKIPPTQLPAHEPAFAMTVHKSQGSEFERVLFVLPERDTPVLTRELIYTGITRAKKHVSLWLQPPVFQTGVLRKTVRTSGLYDALRDAHEAQAAGCEW